MSVTILPKTSGPSVERTNWLAHWLGRRSSASAVQGAPDLSTLGVPASAIIASDAAAASPRQRGPAEAHRILHVGELTPDSGAAEFLSGAIDWAERNPDATVEIRWLGGGDLQGVLQAQMLPHNLVQSFHRQPGDTELAAAFAECGLLVVPNLSTRRCPHLRPAMAAGLPVLASLRCRILQQLVVADETGWFFDPAFGSHIGRALSAALRATPARLDAMRAAAIAHAEKPADIVGRRRRALADQINV